jgi:hypothetical protein
MEQAIGQLVPENYSEADVEELVRVITDQIMTAA